MPLRSRLTAREPNQGKPRNGFDVDGFPLTSIGLYAKLSAVMIGKLEMSQGAAMCGWLMKHQPGPVSIQIGLVIQGVFAKRTHFLDVVLFL
jgi:hypothetical protein